MAISFVAAGTQATNTSSTAGTTLTPGLPAGAAAGDLLLFFISTRSRTPSAITGPAGYTQLFQRSHTSQPLTMWIYYKIHSGSESAQTFTHTGAGISAGCVAQVAAVRGVNSVTPFPNTGSLQSSAVSAANIGPLTGITISARNAVLVLGNRADDWTSVATLSGDSLTWTEIGEPDDTLGTAGSIGEVWDIAIDGGSGTIVSNKTFAVTGGTSNPWSGTMLELGVAPAVYTLSADAGAYVLTGEAATFTKSLHLSAGPGSLVETGQGVNLTKSLHLSAGQGSVVLTGEPATLHRAITMEMLTNGPLRGIDNAHIASYGIKAYWPLQSDIKDAILENNGSVVGSAAFTAGPRQFKTDLELTEYLTFPDTATGFDISTLNGAWFVAGFLNLTDLDPLGVYTIISQRFDPMAFNWALQVEYVVGGGGHPAGYGLIWRLFGPAGLEYVSDLRITDGTDHLVMAYYDPSSSIAGVSLDGGPHETFSTLGYITGGLPSHGGDLQIGAEGSVGDVSGSFDNFLLGKPPTSLFALADTIASYLWSIGERPDISNHYTLTGEPVAFSIGHTLTAGSGTYALTGQDVELDPQFYGREAMGSYVLAGQDIGLHVSLHMQIDPGLYSLTGEDVRLTRGYVLSAGPGSLLATGEDVDLTSRRHLAAEPGSYALTGNDAELSALLNYVLTAARGVYSLDGSDVNLLLVQRQDYHLDLGTGFYDLQGNPIDLRLTSPRGNQLDGGYQRGTRFLLDYTLKAETGTVKLTGGSLGLQVTRRNILKRFAQPVIAPAPVTYHLVIQSGSYHLEGPMVSFPLARHLITLPGSYALAVGAMGITRSHTKAWFIEQEDIELLGLVPSLDLGCP